MKNIYTTLLTGAALLLASAVDAQSINNSKTNMARSRTTLTAPGVSQHPVSSGTDRGTAPPNDECGSVTIDALASGSSLTYNGTTIGATSTGDAVAGSSLDLGGDTTFVFHAFTTTGCNNISVAYCGTTTIPAIYQAVLSTSCPMDDGALINFSAGNFTDCADGNATISWTAVPAGTYYLPVRGEPATAGPYTIVVTATACPAAPANDDCANAISLTSNALCVTTSFTSAGATQSMAAVDCGSISPTANDVFFSFVATSTDQTIGVVGLLGTDAVVELFSGTCGALVHEDCADSNTNFPGATDNFTEQIIETGLTVGTTYYIRVYDWADHGALHNFEICVTEGAGNNIGMEEHSSTADWTVFPNPGSGVFNLRYNGVSTTGTIDVIDVTGRVVYTERTSLGTIHTMDLGGLSAGNYTVRLTVGDARTEQRLMVK